MQAIGLDLDDWGQFSALWYARTPKYGKALQVLRGTLHDWSGTRHQSLAGSQSVMAGIKRPSGNWLLVNGPNTATQPGYGLQVMRFDAAGQAKTGIDQRSVISGMSLPPSNTSVQYPLLNAWGDTALLSTSARGAAPTTVALGEGETLPRYELPSELGSNLRLVESLPSLKIQSGDLGRVLLEGWDSSTARSAIYSANVDAATGAYLGLARVGLLGRGGHPYCRTVGQAQSLIFSPGGWPVTAWMDPDDVLNYVCHAVVDGVRVSNPDRWAQNVVTAVKDGVVMAIWSESRTDKNFTDFGENQIRWRVRVDGAWQESQALTSAGRIFLRNYAVHPSGSVAILWDDCTSLCRTWVSKYHLGRWSTHSLGIDGQMTGATKMAINVSGWVAVLMASWRQDCGSANNKTCVNLTLVRDIGP